MAPTKKRTMKEISEACSAEYMKLRPPSVRRPPSKLDSPVGMTKAPLAKCPKAIPPKAPRPAIQNSTPTSAAGATPSNGSLSQPVIAPLAPPPPAPATQTLNLRKSPRLNAIATKKSPMKKTGQASKTVRPLFHGPAPPPIRPLSSRSLSASVPTPTPPPAAPAPPPAAPVPPPSENNEESENDFESSEEPDPAVPALAPPPSPIHSVGNTDFESSMEQSQAASQAATQNNIVRRSIRELSANLEGDEEKRGKRGVVNGTRVAAKVNGNNKNKIKLTFDKYGDIPDSRADNSLCVHEIGSVVRDEVPMVAATYGQLPVDAYKIVVTRLSVNFEIDPSDKKLWIYITTKSIDRFKDWKYQCKLHYLKYGAEPAPREFEDREDQWKWLCEHFQTSNYKKKCDQMKDTRSKKLDHHSGKMTFAHRSEGHEEKGEVAPFVSTFADAYGVQPAGAALVEKMKGKLSEVVGDPACIWVDDPLPMDVQFSIIEEAVGQKRGRYISGVGKCMKKPARPKGGYKLSAEVQAELQAKADDREGPIQLVEAMHQMVQQASCLRNAHVLVVTFCAIELVYFSLFWGCW